MTNLARGAVGKSVGVVKFFYAPNLITKENHQMSKDQRILHIVPAQGAADSVTLAQDAADSVVQLVSEEPQAQPIKPKKKHRDKFTPSKEIKEFLYLLTKNHPDSFPGITQSGKPWAFGIAKEISEKYGIRDENCEGSN